MEFTFETQYTPTTMAIMAKALRKTIRKKHSRRSHIFGGLVTVLGLLLVIVNFALDFRTFLTVLALLLIVTALLLEDQINGYAASKRLLSGTEKAVFVFSETGFTSVTEIGKTEWSYDKINMIAETPCFFVFIFSASHAQLYSKQSLKGGTTEEFRRFIESAANLRVQQIK